MRILRDVPLYRYSLSLRFSPFQDDESNSITRASAVGVEQIIVPAIGSQYFARVIKLAGDYPALYAALGLHPIIIEEHTATAERLEQLLATRPQKVVAIGEIGLDLYRDDPQFERQQAVLDAQLKLAKRFDLPVILHSRRTHDKLAMHLKRHDLPRTGWYMALPVACSRRNVLSAWDIKLALAVPLPTRAPARPAK
jgi:TatD DNase family protein